MGRQPFDPSIYVHSPADLGVMHVEDYKRILKYPGVQWGIPLVDKYVIPMRPGDLVVICGRPGSGKTSLLARQAKLVAQDIARRGADESECVMYVSWEQHAEEIEAYFQADATYTHTDYSWGRVAAGRRTQGKRTRTIAALDHRPQPQAHHPTNPAAHA
jgi:replicative DNA helicase